MLPPLNSKVKIINGSDNDRTGRVIGYGHAFDYGTEQFVLVKLDFGEYLMSGKTFIGIIVAHPDNLRIV